MTMLSKAYYALRSVPFFVYHSKGDIRDYFICYFFDLKAIYSGHERHKPSNTSVNKCVFEGPGEGRN